MVVVTINRDQLREIAVELNTIEHQLNVIGVVYVNSNDDGVRLTVGLEEPTLADVHDGVTNFGCGNIVDRAVVVNVDGFARGTVRIRSAVPRGTVSLRSVVARGVASHRSAWHRSRGIGACHLVMEKENLMLKFYRLGVLFSVKS